MSHSTQFALCQAALLAGEPLRLRIRGTSMVPALWPGESVTIDSLDMKCIKIGQIVVFSRDGHFVIHRVVRIDPPVDGTNDGTMVTRGDTAVRDDAPVLRSEYLGAVAAVHRFGAARPVRLKPSRSARAVASLIRRSDLARRLLDRLSMLVARKADIG